MDRSPPVGRGTGSREGDGLGAAGEGGEVRGDSAQCPLPRPAISSVFSSQLCSVRYLAASPPKTPLAGHTLPWIRFPAPPPPHPLPLLSCAYLPRPSRQPLSPKVLGQPKWVYLIPSPLPGLHLQPTPLPESPAPRFQGLRAPTAPPPQFPSLGSHFCPSPLP